MGWECFCVVGFDLGPLLQGGMRILHLQYFFTYVLTCFLHLNSCLVTFLHNALLQGTTFLSFSSVSFGISFEHAVQLPFTVLLYSTFPDNYAFLSLSPSQIKNTQSADTVPVHGHSPLVQAICSRWHQPQVDLFATRFNNKLPQFVSPVLDPQAWAVDALSLSWENLDPYAFPPAAILGKVVEKLQDYSCNRIILIAPGWPNMPWFWDLVAMSSQIPLCLPNLPNLVSQPFNQTLHRNLSNLNLHAWLLEPQQSRSRVSLRQWQHKLRLLKEDQPDPSMRQSGPFLQSGASVIRWTSGHHL